MPESSSVARAELDAALAATPPPRTSMLTMDDGTEIACHRWDPDRGTEPDPVPVLLLHGFSVNTMVEWVRRGVVSALTADGRSVVGIDARGHGQSQKSPDRSRYGEPRMALDVREVIAAAGAPRVDLVGYSMGAAVALLVAAAEPAVRRLVVGGVGAGIVELGGVDTRALSDDLVADALLAADVDGLPSQTARIRAFAEMIGSDLPSLAAQARSVYQGGIALASITARSLVIAGDADPLAARPAVLADAIPNADLEIIAGDHDTACAHPGFPAAIVRFLRT